MSHPITCVFFHNHAILEQVARMFKKAVETLTAENEARVNALYDQKMRQMFIRRFDGDSFVSWKRKWFFKTYKNMTPEEKEIVYQEWMEKGGFDRWEFWDFDAKVRRQEAERDVRNENPFNLKVARELADLFEQFVLFGQTHAMNGSVSLTAVAGQPPASPANFHIYVPLTAEQLKTYNRVIAHQTKK